MTLSIDNINKPSNKKWKKVADFFLYTLPLYLTVIMTLPVDETNKMWINFGVSMIVVSLKGLTKLTSDEQVEA